MEEYVLTEIWITPFNIYGRSFKYISKYGKGIEGIIAKIYLQIDEGNLSVYKIESTNGVCYNASEISIL